MATIPGRATIVIVAYVNQAAGQPSHVFASQSADGGATWSHSALQLDALQLDNSTFTRGALPDSSKGRSGELGFAPGPGA